MLETQKWYESEVFHLLSSRQGQLLWGTGHVLGSGQRNSSLISHDTQNAHRLGKSNQHPIWLRSFAVVQLDAYYPLE
jgi:hypothetical protein